VTGLLLRDQGCLEGSMLRCGHRGSQLRCGPDMLWCRCYVVRVQLPAQLQRPSMSWAVVGPGGACVVLNAANSCTHVTVPAICVLRCPVN
jgi:hypothetical protein